MGILTIVKKYLPISIILVLGLALRIICINKPDGLWNDEYVSWMIAATPFSHGFIDAVKSQCHMPFYYLYLKFFMTFFGQSDLVLRLSSVFAGVLSLIIMYLVGKEKDEKTGILCAGFSAISSFLVYYSQEVRFYSVLFLFSALGLLYLIKSVKHPNKKNFILYAIFNSLILFTHTIGFVFVFFNLVFLSINLFKQFKKSIITLWCSIAVVLLGLTPLVIRIFTTQSFSQWWGHFSISKIGFLFTDYFSPLLTNLTNAPDNFLYAKTLSLIMIIPTIIAIGCIVKSLIKNKFNILLFLTTVLSIIVLVLASISGKLVFITKYSIEIYPILIYLACSGLSSIENKLLKNSLIILYSMLCLGYIFLAPYSAPKIRRAEGQKIPTDILRQINLKQDDIILLEYYPANRFTKYFDFSDYRVVEIQKGNFPKYLSANTDYSKIYKSGKDIYKEIFKTNKNSYFENMLQKDIFDNLKTGQSVVVVVLNSVSFYSPQSMAQIIENDDAYNKTPLLFLVFSYIKNETFNEMLKTLSITNFAQKGNWTVVKFTKLNKTGLN